MDELKSRIAVLKAMDDFFKSYGGDEGYWYTWIELGVPDEPSEEDFEYIANDWEQFNYCCGLFARLMDKITKEET